MTAGQSHTASGMGYLEEALSAVKSVVTDMGVARVAVVVVKNNGSVRIVYHWPDSGSNAGQVERIGGTEPATVRLAALATWLSTEIRRLQRELTVVSGRLGQSKTLERAKGLLQGQHGWSEPQAYEHLRKLSRQRRKPMAEIAQAVLRAG